MPRPTILIAEDDVITRWDLREILIAHGYRVLEAGDGEEAVTLARTHRPDLLLLDIKMPKADGFEVAERLFGQDIPILFLTAYSQKDMVDRATALAVQGFLVKPAPEGEVVAQVELALKNAERLRTLTRALDRTTRSLNERKDVDRAKEVLARKLGCSLEEAYRLLRKKSMDEGRPIGQVAQQILREEGT